MTKDKIASAESLPFRPIGQHRWPHINGEINKVNVKYIPQPTK